MPPDHHPRIGFAGTPDFAARHLQALLDAGLRPTVVYTQPDRPAGRGKKLQASPVKALALAHQLPLMQPTSLKEVDAAEKMRSFALDILVVVAYGLILPPAILAVPRHGCINVHASLLPRWRGAAPIERAILAGDHESGVTLMQMDAGLDTGDILLQATTPINTDDNAASLTERLAELGGKVLLQGLEELRQKGELRGQTQNADCSCYAAKLEKSEAQILWNQDAGRILRQINAFFPRSPAWSMLGGERIRILHARAIQTDAGQPPGTIVRADKEGLLVSCRASSLLVTDVQLPGKKAASIAAILHGQARLFATGARFSHQDGDS